MEKLIETVQSSKLNQLLEIIELTSCDIINSHDDKGFTALHYASDLDEIESFKVLLEKGKADIHLKTKNKGLTCLHLASMSNSLRVLKFILMELYSDTQVIPLIDQVNDWGESALHLAAAAGNVEVIEILISKGANADIYDKWKRLPLTVAKENGDSKIIDILSKVTKELETAVSSVVEHQPMGDSQKKLIEDFMTTVAKRENKNYDYESVEVKHVIKFDKPEKIIPKPITNTKKMALSKKIEYPGDVDLVKKLLMDETIDPAGPDMFGVTALHKFAAWGKVDLLELLLPHLTHDDMNVTSQSEGFSALHWCLEMGNTNTLETLVKDNRVRHDIKDKSGKTALEMALECLPDAVVILKMNN
eukprot:TRINITY_DN9688_c0_g1_i1.p1 TRINITY_DN9688_c0_g1~~TRINITY_DN9688_c0_g1_i1.p1  ORF type:complete len:361 (+),score=81.08 TRINITY_DN9688_c0_g1_i1:145-1227(+)